MQNLLAGVTYFGFVFGLGFVLGTLRQLAMQLGAARDLLVWLEIPVMLGFAWWAAGWCIRRFRVAPSRGARLIVLRLGELAVGVGLMRQSLQEHFAALGTSRGLLELMPQVLAASFPLLRARLEQA
jgi:hypothetical protein